MVIILAGATGELGGRIARDLRRREATVTALVRRGGVADKLARLRALGVSVVELDLDDQAAVMQACRGADCVVSALNGLRPVIVETQTVLLKAAVAAGVPRFIPSDFSLDFTKTAPGSNRNLDLRRDFHARADGAAIRLTSILNGAFANLLAGQAPLILYGFKRVLYWGDADQRLDFTAMDDVAAFTAAAALDVSAPRTLRIAGIETSAREMAAVASEVTGQRFRLLRAGGVGLLAGVIAVTRALFPSRESVFPPWQGMQYMHNMFSGQGKLAPLDNDRYPGMHWTSLREVIGNR